LQGFAAQAVIAMENARLLGELRQRTDDLARTVDELSATGDVLKTISRSSTDLKAVLDILLETVARLCRADQAYMYHREEELHHLVAAYGLSPEGETYVRTHPFQVGRGTASGRVVLERRPVHIEDVLEDPEYTYTGGQSAAGFRTMLGLPLLREDTLIGVFVLSRTQVEPFTPREIELANSFADQAVIAIENARLFEELRESLDQQTASAQILQVISQSPTDVAPVLDAVVAAALRFCGAEDAVIGLKVGDRFVVTAHEGTVQADIGTRRPLDRSLGMTRAIVDCQTVHLPDMLALDPGEYAAAIALARTLGFKAALAAPMVRDGVAIGSILLRKKEAGPFTPRQIALLETFAAQAVIAIENVRLFTR
ncbi:MAG: GAF domain-containing protein, partial [Solimonas sp.]